MCARFLINIENNNLLLYIYLFLFWILLSLFFRFYEVYRFTSVLKIISLLIKQFVAFTVILFAFLGLLQISNIGKTTVFQYIILASLCISTAKILMYYTLKKYRLYLGGNYRNVVIIGNSTVANQLKKFFNEKTDLGYNLKGIFSNTKSAQHSGTIKDSLKFIKSNAVDEIYCVVEELSDDQINEYVKLSDENYITLKFVPNTKKIFSKRMHTDYYEYLPVLSFQGVSLNNQFNKYLKRIFDIVFSLFMMLFIMSWLVPILAILIKLETKGPVFFKHTRNGVNYKEFMCYKLRSLYCNKSEEFEQVKDGDQRVTKLGKFMRKTSMDELPQFYNCLIGNMSVVGPRPHMVMYTQQYAKKIDKYNFMFRHSVKPGITGLAQVSGFRGEIANDTDIINRIKYDIFYIENWSLLLDIKIIIQTLLNIIKGEKKAY